MERILLVEINHQNPTRSGIRSMKESTDKGVVGQEDIACR